MRARLITLLLALVTGLPAAGGAIAASALSAQSNTAAGVTVKATPRALPGGAWEFEIVFDTHTQELNDDPAKSASLVAGGRALAPAAWQGDPPGGHHRKGVLKFNALDPQPQAIELRIARPGEARPRVFNWRLK
ncbi:MAG: hypothetical protein HYY78_02955 [Betaproteobacteria bacterium]|nr:hypothetical protein [Betaproteobacteria bacterium]